VWAALNRARLWGRQSGHRPQNGQPPAQINYRRGEGETQLRTHRHPTTARDHVICRNRLKLPIMGGFLGG